MRLRLGFRLGLRLRSGLRLRLQERREGGLRLQRGLRLERRGRGRGEGDLALDGAGIGGRIGELARHGGLELDGDRDGRLELDGTGVGVLARTLRCVLALNLDLHLVLARRRITVRGERDLGGCGVVRERSGSRSWVVVHESDARIHRRDALVDYAQRIQKLVAGGTGDHASANHLLDRKDLNVVIKRGEQEIRSDVEAFSRSHQASVARFGRGASAVAPLAVNPVERMQHAGCADRSTSHPF